MFDFENQQLEYFKYRFYKEFFVSVFIVKMSVFVVEFCDIIS